MKLSCSPYKCIYTYNLNTLNKDKISNGFLLKCEFRELGTGYSLLHSHPELGQVSSTEILNQFKEEKSYHPLLKNALRIAKIDAYFRQKKQWALDGLKIPASHFLVQDIEDFTQKDIQQYFQMGFSKFKLKLGPHNFSKLNDFVTNTNKVSTKIKLRLDFNASFSLHNFAHKLVQNLQLLQQNCDFIEEPFAFDFDAYIALSEKHHLNFAIDHLHQNLDLDTEAKNLYSFSPIILAIKPSADPLPTIKNILQSRPSDFYVSHNMDHPLGMQIASYFAALWSKQFPDHALENGLLNPSLLPVENYPVHKTEKPFFLPQTGLGFGYDSALSNEDWQFVVQRNLDG